MAFPRQYAVALAAGLVAFTVAKPAGAQGRYDAQGHYIISAARAAAIHECSLRASRYPEYLWGTMATYQYRACMAGHDQQE
jgi:hypothetical protein